MDKGKDSGLVIPSSAMRGGKTNRGHCTAKGREKTGEERHDTLMRTSLLANTLIHPHDPRAVCRIAAVQYSAMQHILVAYAIAVYSSNVCELLWLSDHTT
jgi:hypothetical protein